jgi:hypothetical protein
MRLRHPLHERRDLYKVVNQLFDGLSISFGLACTVHREGFAHSPQAQKFGFLLCKNTMVNPLPDRGKNLGSSSPPSFNAQAWNADQPPLRVFGL